ncbi:MAG: hypothetical protein RR326_06310, partial [Stenotrophomonas sp.]
VHFSTRKVRSCCCWKHRSQRFTLEIQYHSENFYPGSNDFQQEKSLRCEIHFEIFMRAYKTFQLMRSRMANPAASTAQTMELSATQNIRYMGNNSNPSVSFNLDVDGHTCAIQST